MAGFVSLEEAAERLGVTKERLNTLREEGRARAFRDGTGWKFKEDEVDRLATAGIAAGDEQQAGVDDVDLDLDSELDLSDDSDSILLNDEELGEGDETSSSTIIGEEGSGDAQSDLALELDGSAVGESEVLADSEGQDDTVTAGGESEVTLDASNVLSADAGGSGIHRTEDGALGSKFENLEELDLDLESSQLQLEEGDSGTAVAKASDEAPSSPASPDSAPTESSISDLAESSIKLAADDDDELVLGGEPSSDLTLTSQQSGISLIDASDTGISLEEAPIDLSGSSAESLALGDEGSFALSDSMVAGSSVIAGDEDILLSGSGVSKAGESGSQVLAFDLEGDIDENTATILGADSALGSEAPEADEAPARMLEEDVEETSLGAVAAPTAAAVGTPIAVREAQYSAWNLAFLVLCAVLLMLSGAMMFDLLRSMWSWNEPSQLNSSIMDAILSVLP